MTRIARELAGLTTPAGNVDRPLQSVAWRVPARVALDGDRIAWADDSANEGPRQATAGPQMLKRFLALASAPPERVEAFARTFGQLHRPAIETYETTTRYATEGSEPLAWWNILVREATAVLDIAAVIRNPKMDAVPAGMWERFETLEVKAVQRPGYWSVNFEPVGPLALSWSSAVLTSQQVLAMYVGSWFSRVGVGFDWSASSGAQVILNPGGLVGALGLQLAQALAGTAGIAVTCRGCAGSFAPHHGNQRYCEACRELNEPQRRATKAYRSRR